MNLEKWFYFIFAHSSPSANYKCMSAMYGYSGQILFQDWCSCYTVYPSINILKCQKLHFLRVECQFLFYLEQFTQQKSKRFDSCSYWGKDWLLGVNVQIHIRVPTVYIFLGQSTRQNGSTNQKDSFMCI